MNNPQVICQPRASHTRIHTQHFIQTRALPSPRTASETTLPPNTRHCNRNHALPDTRRSVCDLNLSRTLSAAISPPHATTYQDPDKAPFSRLALRVNLNRP